MVGRLVMGHGFHFVDIHAQSGDKQGAAVTRGPCRFDGQGVRLASVDFRQNIACGGQGLALVRAVAREKDVAIRVQQYGFDGGGAAVEAEPGIACGVFEGLERRAGTVMAGDKVRPLFGGAEGEEPSGQLKGGDFAQIVYGVSGDGRGVLLHTGMGAAPYATKMGVFGQDRGRGFFQTSRKPFAQGR